MIGKLVHVVGKRNQGKTRLVGDLVRELAGRGLRVGAWKHSRHDHEVDRPGKDSWLHREAGAEPAAFVTSAGIGVYLDRRDGEDPAERLAPLFADCDVVLVEGWIDGPGPKIEVWRAETGADPLAAGRDDLRAIVTDDDPDVDLPLWPRDDVAALADRLLGLLADGEA